MTRNRHFRSAFPAGLARRKLRGAMLGALAALALAQAPHAAEPKSPQLKVVADQMKQVDVVQAEQRPFHLERSAIGQIAFNDNLTTAVLAPFSGRVTQLLAQVGQEVKGGDPLFEIDSPEVVQAQTDFVSALNAVEKARSQLALAKRVLDRQASLLADKATAQREVDAARNDVASAESDLLTAQSAVTAARNRVRVIFNRSPGEVERIERDRQINPLVVIPAPIDGTVISRKVGPGQFVRSDSADPLVTLADMSTMWLRAYVSESDMALVRLGQEIEVRVTAFPGKVFAARIVAIGASSDPATRRVAIRSEIANPDRLLKAEMFATFKIRISTEVSVAVPTASVVREGTSATVWVEKEPFLFERRRVTIGLEQDGRVQIVTGLAPGERVAGRGALFLDNEWQQQ